MKGYFAIVVIDGRAITHCRVVEERHGLLQVRFVSQGSRGNFAITRNVPIADTINWLFFETEKDLQAFQGHESDQLELAAAQEAAAATGDDPVVEGADDGSKGRGRAKKSH